MRLYIHPSPYRSVPYPSVVSASITPVVLGADYVDRKTSLIQNHPSDRRIHAQVDTYTGSSETDLLSKLAQHLPQVGNPVTEPSPGGSGLAGAGSSGAKIRSGQGESGEGVNEEDVPGESSVALMAAEALIDAFDGNVDVARLLRDIRRHAAEASGGASSDPSRPLLPTPPLPRAPGETPIQTTKAAAGSSSGQPWAVSAAAAIVEQQGATEEDGGGGEKRETGGSGSSVKATKPAPAAAAAVPATRKSRQEVEAEAAKLGASGG